MSLIFFNNLLTFIDKPYCPHVLRWVFGILAFVTEIRISVWKMCVEHNGVGTLAGKPSSVCPPNTLNLCIGRSDYLRPDTWSDVAPPAKKHNVYLLSGQRLSLQLFFLTAGTYCNARHRNW